MWYTVIPGNSRIFRGDKWVLLGIVGVSVFDCRRAFPRFSQSARWTEAFEDKSISGVSPFVACIRHPRRYRPEDPPLVMLRESGAARMWIPYFFAFKTDDAMVDVLQARELVLFSAFARAADYVIRIRRRY